MIRWFLCFCLWFLHCRATEYKGCTDKLISFNETGNLRKSKIAKIWPLPFKSYSLSFGFESQLWVIVFSRKQPSTFYFLNWLHDTWIHNIPLLSKVPVSSDSRKVSTQTTSGTFTSCLIYSCLGLTWLFKSNLSTIKLRLQITYLLFKSEVDPSWWLQWKCWKICSKQ